MSDLERIVSLQNQLMGLGYRTYQIDDICQEVIGTSKIDTLTPNQYQILTEVMEDYIAFAHKCLKNKISK